MTDIFIATGNSFARIRENNGGWTLEKSLHGKGAQSIQ